MVAVGDQHAFVVHGGHHRAHVGAQLRQAGPHLAQVRQVAEDAPLDRGAVVAALHAALVQDGAPGPPRVGLMTRLRVPVRVIELAELITAPDDRHAAPAVDDGVGQPQGVEALLEPGAQLLLLPGRCGLVNALDRFGGGLDADQARSSAGDAAVVGDRVVLEDQAAGVAHGVGGAVPVRQEDAMPVAVEADRIGVGIANGPADVVMAADVGDPGGGVRLDRQGAQGVGGERDIAGGEHGPDLDHEGVVVGEVGDLARVLALAEVLEKLGGGDDRLGLEIHRRGRDAGDGPQHLGDGVDLGLALAVGALALDGEGDGVQAQDLHALVGQVHDDGDELLHDARIAPVEVPLEGVEGRPDPAAHLVVPGEVARGEVGEDLRQSLLVLVGLGAVRVDEEVVAVALLARAGALGPLVLGGDMVEDEVDDQADAVPAQLRGQIGEVVHIAQVGAHGAVVGHRVPAVGVPRAGSEQGHEVEVGHAQLAQVWNAVDDAAQVAGEALGVAGVADARGVLDPGGVERARQVEVAQLRVALGVGPGGVGEQDGGGARGDRLAVERHEAVADVGVPAFDPGGEDLALGAGELRIGQDGVNGVADLVGDLDSGVATSGPSGVGCGGGGLGGAHGPIVTDLTIVWQAFRRRIGPVAHPGAAQWLRAPATRPGMNGHPGELENVNGACRAPGSRSRKPGAETGPGD